MLPLLPIDLSPGFFRRASVERQQKVARHLEQIRRMDPERGASFVPRLQELRRTGIWRNPVTPYASIVASNNSGLLAIRACECILL
jgi:hypothetical protein